MIKSIDIYNNDISDTEKNLYISQVKMLKQLMDNSENLHESQIQFIKENFNQLIGLVPIDIRTTTSLSKPFERLVINEQVTNGENRRLKSLADLRYPPLKISDKIDFNRASMKGECVLYAGSMGSLPISIEVKPTKGQLVTKSNWTFNKKRALKLMSICYNFNMAMKNPGELIDDYNDFKNCLNEMKPNCRAVIEEVTDFIVKAFTREVSTQNRKGYLMSALISEYYFNHSDHPVDAIYYPSYPNKGSAMNIAIKPEVVDELFDMTEATESIVVSDPSDGSKGWLNFRTGICKNFDQNSLVLNWENSPIPDSEIAVKGLISHYKITFE